MRTFLTPILAALMFGLAVKARALALTDTPAAVQTAIHLQIGDGTVSEIDQTNQDGETTFEVSYTTKSGDEHDFTVADDGTVLSVEMELAETPAAVQKTIHDQVSGWELQEVDKNLDDTEISYEVDVSKSGREKSLVIANDGVLLSEDMTLEETPDPVQAAIKGQMGDGKLTSISREFDTEGDSFDVEGVGADGARKAFSVGLDGKMLSVEVSLEKVPPAARKTIEAKIAGGKILHIDRSLEERKMGVLPYEVEGRKDGKPFNFSVGPKGRFLGVDE